MNAVKKMIKFSALAVVLAMLALGYRILGGKKTVKTSDKSNFLFSNANADVPGGGGEAAGGCSGGSSGSAESGSALFM